jgi:hypothetical protein
VAAEIQLLACGSAAASWSAPDFGFLIALLLRGARMAVSMSHQHWIFLILFAFACAAAFTEAADGEISSGSRVVGTCEQRPARCLRKPSNAGYKDRDAGLASDDGPVFSTAARLVEAKRSIPEGTQNDRRSGFGLSETVPSPDQSRPTRCGHYR